MGKCDPKMRKNVVSRKKKKKLKDSDDSFSRKELSPMHRSNKIITQRKCTFLTLVGARD